MKKPVFLMTAILAAITAAGIYTSQSKQQCNSTSLALSNVEALGRTEISEGVWTVVYHTVDHWDCLSGGGVSCPGTPW